MKFYKQNCAAWRRENDVSRYPSRQIEILMKGRAYDELKYQHTQLQSQLTTALAKNAELEQQVKESQEQEPVADITDAQLAAFKVISGSEACPLCGDAFIHTHSPKEIVIYRNGVKYGRKLYAAPVISEKKEEGK